MAVIESNLNTSDLDKSVLIICPICKIKKQVNVPKSVISEAKQLTSISISKDIVCEHHFQAFVDKNFIVRGYQKVDYQLETKLNNKESHLSNISKESDDELFNNLILESNYVEYSPRKKFYQQNHKKLPEVNTLHKSSNNEMSLADIYEEFWEFINDDNEEFYEYINKDSRRRKINSNS